MCFLFEHTGKINFTATRIRVISYGLGQKDGGNGDFIKGTDFCLHRIEYNQDRLTLQAILYIFSGNGHLKILIEKNQNIDSI